MIQAAQTTLIHLSKSYDTVNSHVQQKQSEYERHLHCLDTQLLEQTQQIKIIDDQLVALSPIDTTRRLNQLETLPQTVEQLKSQLDAFERTIRTEVNTSQKKLARKYQWLGLVSAIAAAGLALLG